MPKKVNNIVPGSHVHHPNNLFSLKMIIDKKNYQPKLQPIIQNFLGVIFDNSKKDLELFCKVLIELYYVHFVNTE
jgi:hypothetical protein